jgi:hypothetical protein
VGLLSVIFGMSAAREMPGDSALSTEKSATELLQQWINENFNDPSSATIWEIHGPKSLRNGKMQFGVVIRAKNAFGAFAYRAYVLTLDEQTGTVVATPEDFEKAFEDKVTRPQSD